MTTAKQRPNLSAQARRRCRLTLILLAVAMILIGIFFFGELEKVQTNAHYICLDCIVIG